MAQLILSYPTIRKIDEAVKTIVAVQESIEPENDYGL